MYNEICAVTHTTRYCKCHTEETGLVIEYPSFFEIYYLSKLLQIAANIFK